MPPRIFTPLITVNIMALNFESLWCVNVIQSVLSCLPRQVHKVRHVVVQVRESNAVFCANWLTDDDFVNVVKLIPVIIAENIRVIFNNYVI